MFPCATYCCWSLWQASKPGGGGGFSLSAVWSTFVVLMFVGFLGSIMTSTARTYLLHQQQHKMRLLQQQLKQRQSATREQKQAQGGMAGGAPGGEPQGISPGQREGQFPGGRGGVYQGAGKAWMGPKDNMQPRVEEGEVEDEVLGH